MDRPKRAATKVTDFRKFHLSGDLNEQLQGRVDTRVTQFKMASTLEELRQQLENSKEKSRKMQQEAEMLRIQQEPEAEKLKQKEWHVAIEELKETRSQMELDHKKNLEQVKQLALASREDSSNKVLQWYKSQLESLKGTGDPTTINMEEEQKKKEAEEKAAAIQELKQQQEDISKKLAELTGETHGTPPVGSDTTTPSSNTAEVLLQQLKTALSGKTEDHNKTLLRALSLPQNKTTTEGGTNTLKSSILNSILPGEGPTSMADWLASLNRQEEGESDFLKLPLGKGKWELKVGPSQAYWTGQPPTFNRSKYGHNRT